MIYRQQKKIVFFSYFRSLNSSRFTKDTLSFQLCHIRIYNIYP